MSKIEWTHKTWNPVTGCTRVSAGCDNCYAVTMTRRCAAMGQAKYQGLINPDKDHFNGIVKTHPAELHKPLGWKKPYRVFVNSMSDLFHPGVPKEFILDVFGVMRRAGQHEFQILTKRPARVLQLDGELDWPPNVWMGTSVENQSVLHRADELRQTGARVKFLSCEPLIGSLSGLNLAGIDWVIAGGESGAGARKMDPDWAREVRDACASADVPFFFKQWGEFDEAGKRVGKKNAGRQLNGQCHDAYPPSWNPLAELSSGPVDRVPRGARRRAARRCKEGRQSA